MMHVTQNSNIVGLNMKHNFPIIIPVEPIGPGAVVKLHYGNQVSKKKNVCSPVTRKDSIMSGASVNER